MEWHIMTGEGGMTAISSNLGCRLGDIYVVADTCEESLEELLTSLQHEDHAKRNVRQAIALNQLIKTDLIPIMIYSNDDPTIFSLCARILAKLSTPPEFLIQKQNTKTKDKQDCFRDLQKMVGDLKDAMCDRQVAEAVVSEMQQILEDYSEETMTSERVDTMQNILVWLGNTLRSQHDKSNSNVNNDNGAWKSKNQHAQIIRNFLEEGLGEVIISLCARPEMDQKLISMLHLLCVIFKEESVDEFVDSCNGKKRESLATDMWGLQNNTDNYTLDMECAMDDIANELKHKAKYTHGISGEMTGEPWHYLSTYHTLHNIQLKDTADGETLDMVTSEERDSYSDEDSMEKSDSNSGSSDLGQGSMVSLGSSISSDEDSDDSMTTEYRILLRDFAIAFTKHGLDKCSTKLKASDSSVYKTELTYFWWAVGYFTQLTALPEVLLSDLTETVSAGMTGTLCYLTLRTWEAYASSKKTGQADVYFSRLCILVKALREIFTTLSRYMKRNMADSDNNNSSHARSALEKINKIQNVYDLYVLLIRKFNRDTETVEYLRELVMGNSELLLATQQLYNEDSHPGKLQMKAHIEKFSTPQVMASYTHLLSKFSENGPVVNEAILTMMFHVAADANKIESLYQASLLSTFANIWEENYSLSEVSESFMDYVVQMFTEFAKRDMNQCTTVLLRTENQRSGDAKDGKAAEKQEENKSAQATVDPCKDQALSVHQLLESTLAETLYGCLQMVHDEGYGKQLQHLQSWFLEVCYVKLSCPKYEPPEPIAYFYSSEGKSVPLVMWTDEDEECLHNVHFRKSLQFLGLHLPEDNHMLFPSIPSFWTAEMCYKRASELGPVRADDLKFEVTEDGRLLQEQQTTTPDEKMEESPRSVKKLMKGTTRQLPASMWMHNITKVNNSLSRQQQNRQQES
ncbi:protein timeless-like isoform X2 [Ptychodera flava]|uniref:protein timeless-like isoform X2 n=1 Tax=Ptychodera flava TaxID=63121 RepID=UPI00396AB10D